MSRRERLVWSDVGLVAGREVDEKLHSRSFLVSTLLFLVLVGASVTLPALLGDGPPEYDVAVVGTAAAQLVEAVPGSEVALTAAPVPDAADADRLLAAEDADAAVEVRGDTVVVSGLTDVPGDLVQALAATAQVRGLQTGLADAGVSAQEAQRLLAPVAVQERVVDDRGVGADVLQLLSFASALLFFFVVYQFGFAIAQGVVQEKESRVVELLVTAVPVRTLLVGKVLGNGGLALAQVVLLVLAAAGGAAATGETALLGVLARNGAWFVLFFALGFALLSCLWAAAGAFASRTEDLQSTTAPLQVLVLAPFFASAYVSDGPVRDVLSFVPFTSPLIMPARLLEGDAAGWEAALAAALLLVAAAGAVVVGERLYRASLLRTRGRTSLADAWSGREGAGG